MNDASLAFGRSAFDADDMRWRSDEDNIGLIGYINRWRRLDIIILLRLY